jgi:O-antigen/teichoic acid export membrane protein
MLSKIEAWSLSRALCRGRAILTGGGAKFFRDLSVLVGGQIAARLIGFLAFAYLARRLDPEAYGSVEFIVGLAGLFSTMADLGLGTIGIRRAAAAPRERPLLAAQISVIRFCIALICALAMIISVHAASNSPVLHGLVLLYAASLLWGAWYQEWLLQSAALMAQVAFAQILRTSVFLLVIMLLVRDSGDAQLVGWGEIAAVIAAVAYSLYVQQHRIAPIRFLASVKSKDLIREAIPVGLSNAVWSAAQYAPLFLMGAIVGGSDTGIFAGANRLVASIAVLSFVYHFNLYAAAASTAAEDHTALVALMRDSFRVVAWATIGGALWLSLAAAPILRIVFGPDFESAAPVLAIMIWTVPVMFLSGHARWPLILAKLEQNVFFAQVSGLVTVGVLGFVLVRSFDGIGAAAAALAGNLVVWGTSYALALLKKVPTPPLSLAAKPLTLALALWFCVQALTLDPWIGACTALIIYVFSAFFLDRALVSAAHAIADSTKRQAS